LRDHSLWIKALTNQINMWLYKIFLSLFFVTLGSLTVPTAFADISYLVTVDTSTLTAGYIGFALNPGSGSTQAATANVTSFLTDGLLSTSDHKCPSSCVAGSTGSVSGMLPGTVSLINSSPGPNEYIESITFGNSVTFDLVLSGAAVSNPNGEGGGIFTLDFLNYSATGYLFTHDSSDVPVFTVHINPDGTTTATTYLGDNGLPVVTFSSPLATPEPSFKILMAGALLSLLVFGRRHILKRGIVA
jgi:hypothetical protein